MSSKWAIWAMATAMGALGGCSDDSSAGGGTAYTQIGDVSLDGTVGSDAGDDALGTDATGADATVSDSAVDDSTVNDSAGTDAIADTGPAKYPECLSLIGCIAQSCSPANWAPGCDATCLTGTSPAVAAGYASVSACIQNTCRDGLCKGSSDPKCIGQCIGAKCMNKIAVCGANGKTGTAICGSYFTCSQACGTAKDPLACVSTCYAALSDGAQSEYAALDACTSAAGGSDAFASCPEQALTCLAGGASGNKSCIDALGCAGACNIGTDAQKGACMTQCWSQTSSAAQTAFAGALKCSGINKTGCVDSMLACTDPSGTATCTATLTCMQGCQQTDPQAKATCFYGCLHTASPAEAKKNLDLQVCMGNCNCNGDQTCTNTCLLGPCKAALATCQAP